LVDSARRRPKSPAGSPYCSEKEFKASTLQLRRTAVAKNVVCSQAWGSTPMPGCGLSLMPWNMPRISAVALSGAR
jgi:hypothetical protein